MIQKNYFVLSSMTNVNQITIFLDVMPCSLRDVHRLLTGTGYSHLKCRSIILFFYSEDGGSRLLRIDGKFIPDYTALNSRNL
jgi:hypothetical protein